MTHLFLICCMGFVDYVYSYEVILLSGYKYSYIEKMILRLMITSVTVWQSMSSCFSMSSNFNWFNASI